MKTNRTANPQMGSAECHIRSGEVLTAQRRTDDAETLDGERLQGRPMPKELHLHQHNYCLHFEESLSVSVSQEAEQFANRWCVWVVAFLFVILLFAPELISLLTGYELPKK
jgi:hypothetical protein